MPPVHGFVPLLDDELLQYQLPGDSGECDIVIGLDFGTAASKVVIQVHGVPGNPAYAVDFGELAHPSMQYLLPTKLWVSDDGLCSLKEHINSKLIQDIKLELFCNNNEHIYSIHGSTKQDIYPEATAVAYLALLLRYSRRWFLENKYDVVRHLKKLNWSCNLGVPSPCINDNEENKCFRMVGKVAWIVSVLYDQVIIKDCEKEYDLLLENPHHWEEDVDRIFCDFDIIPEIAAGAVGYAFSSYRRNDLHLMIDVGATTVDICSFLLCQPEGDDRYSLLTADVKQYGVIMLHHKRVQSVQQLSERIRQNLCDKQDPLMPIPENDEPYLISHDKIKLVLRRTEEELINSCKKILWKAILDLRNTRAPNEDVWQEGKFPILLIGGGSRLQFYRSIVDELDSWIAKYTPCCGIDLITIPIPESLKNQVSVDYDRLAVAWGLSHRSPNIGDIIPLDQIPDMAPPPKRDWKSSYISHDQE